MNPRPAQDGPEDDPYDRGLQFDLGTLLLRRHLLKFVSGGAMVALVGCGDDDSPSATATSSGSTPTTAGGATSAATRTVSPIPTGVTPASGCTDALPEETAGPYPGDGSNGPNALTQSGIVRNDITASLDGGTAAEGVPLAIVLTVVDIENDCEPLAGAAVYLWHCDREGRYSMYSAGVTEETYLRGVAEADANGVVTFQTVFPGCYPGRWPHVHFEVYPGVDVATSSANKRATSQLALPEDVCEAVYAEDGYEQSVPNLAQLTLDSDNVFRDGWELQLAAVTGSVASGYTATLLLGV